LCWKCDQSARRTSRLEEANQPTERQVKYAHDLGLIIPPDATFEDVSKLISIKLDGDGEALARQYGVDISGIRYNEAILTHVGNVLDVRKWIWSVCRHMKNANWVRRDHSKIPSAAVESVVKVFLADPANLDAIGDLNMGYPPDNIEAVVTCMEAAGLPGPDEWYFFQEKMLLAAVAQSIRKQEG